MRLQVQGSVGAIRKYSGGTFGILHKIYMEEGLNGIFKGVGPALLCIPVFWSVYWPIYDRMKLFLSETMPGYSPHLQHLGAALSAGVVGDIITNPFWVVRYGIYIHINIPIQCPHILYVLWILIYCHGESIA